MHINLNAMGTRMKRRRKELKMSQAELAEKVNVSNNHISSIETGKQIPSLTTFVKICEQLDTTPDFLLLGSLHTDNLPKKALPQLSVIIVISHVPQLCFKQLPATSSIHCTFYHF